MFNLDFLKGQTIAITGASRGIGKETALLLGSLGANLALGSRNLIELEQVALEVQLAGGHAIPIQLDVSDEESVCHFVDHVLREFGTIDALINCAGVGVFSSVMDLSTEDFDRMISINLRGTFLCCKHVGQHMLQNGSGHIVNLVSIAGTTALPGCSGYSASKFGVLGLSRVLQAELRAKGIQVTSMLPGAVNSPFWNDIEPKPDVNSMIPLVSLARHIVYILCQTYGAVVDEITIMPPLGIL